MNRTIRVLDQHTANQIAAGEVIERPASVIKEIVENSIDAGSTKIEISFEGSGVGEIRISDNGSGMSRADCGLAFERHATSKIKNQLDLDHIDTLGFRGEALPSIAAVSKVLLQTRDSSSLAGTSIYLEGGKVQEINSVGCPIGTEIVVKDLFFNTPARKKYLKKPGTETARVINIVQKLAIAHPEISFGLSRNGQQLFITKGSDKFEDVLIEIYGLEYIAQMIPFSYESNGLKIKGMVGKSFFHRSSREQQTLIVNGRYVRNTWLQNILDDAFSGLLPSRRYPVAVIYFNVLPETIDVNVHPTKSEIKFTSPGAIEDGLRTALDLALNGATHIPSLRSVPKQTEVKRRTAEVREAVEIYLQTQWQDFTTKKSVEPVFPITSQPSAKDSKIFDIEVAKVQKFPELRAIGQLHQLFILAQGTAGLYIIDQHGAHERINFEHLQKQVENSESFGQLLAVPITLELNAAEQDLLLTYIVEFTEIGIIIEHFGENTFLVRAGPPELSGADISELIYDLLTGWRDKSIKDTGIVEAGLKLLACKQAVKANETMSLTEQQMLIDQLSLLKQPFTCPHGRPIIVNYNLQDLRKRFGRN